MRNKKVANKRLFEVSQDSFLIPIHFTCEKFETNYDESNHPSNENFWRPFEKFGKLFGANTRFSQNKKRQDKNIKKKKKERKKNADT